MNITPRMPVTKVETITPEIARKLLEGNTNNRPISDTQVAEYADAMREGRWQINNASIGIAHDGTIVDGQHRLWACVTADTSFQTSVMRGLDPNCFDTIDIGRKRSAGDILHIDGFKYAKTVSAAIRWLPVLTNEGNANSKRGGAKLTNDLVRIRARTQGAGLETSAAYVAKRCTNLLAPAIATALHYLFAQQDAAQADEFFQSLHDGQNLAKGDPILALRERLFKDKVQKSRLPQQETAALTIRAWNSFREQTQVTVLAGSRKGRGAEKAKMPGIK